LTIQKYKEAEIIQRRYHEDQDSNKLKL